MDLARFLIWKSCQAFRLTVPSHRMAKANNGSDGTYWISTGGDMADDDSEINDSHVKAYAFLVEHQEQIKNTILG